MMHRFATILLIVSLAVTRLTGCAAVPIVSESSYSDMWPGADATTLSFDLFPATRKWMPQIREQYPNALVVAVHGETDPVSGDWMAYPSLAPPVPVSMLVDRLRLNYPDRMIVLLTCNPDGKTLDKKNVVYAKDNVWSIPDCVSGDDPSDPTVGSLDEFIHPDTQGAK